MNIIQKLAVKLFLQGDSKMRTYEKKLMSHVGKRLNPEARQVLEYQLSKINLVYRSPDGREVNLYAMAGIKKQEEMKLLFTDRGDDRIMATVLLETEASPQTMIKAKIGLVDGKLFTIIFNKDPAILAHINCTITSCILHIDPMCKESVKHGKSPELTPMLDKLNKIWPVSELKPPLKEAVLNNGQKLGDLTLPRDYLEFLKESSGCRIGEWIILGADARNIQFEDKEILMIAENPEVANLCVIQNETLPHLISYDYSTREMQQMGSDFLEAFRKIK